MAYTQPCAEDTAWYASLLAWWWRLKGLEAKWTIVPLQRAIQFEHVQPIIKLTKVCTRRGAYAAYGTALLGACPRCRYAELAVSFVLSRRLNEWLKKIISQRRPYVEFPDDVVHFKKRKDSHSFPSQSVQTLSIAWCAFVDGPVPQQAYLVTLVRLSGCYFATLIALVAIVRVYRGLHYLHDVLASVLIARLIVTAASTRSFSTIFFQHAPENKNAQVAVVFQHIAGSKSIAALLVSCFSAQELSPVVSDNDL